MQNFQDALETSKQLSINAFSICMTAPLMLVMKSYANAMQKVKKQYSYMMIIYVVQIIKSE